MVGPGVELQDPHPQEGRNARRNYDKEKDVWSLGIKTQNDRNQYWK